MKGSFFSGRRKLALALAIPVAIIASVVTGISPASAWHADITAKADCKGVVSFTSTSWEKSNRGTNPNIAISYSVNGGSYTAVTPKAGGTYAFTAANGYMFSDSFQLPARTGAVKVTVKAKAVGLWGGNYNEQSERTAIVNVPAPCAEPAVPSAVLTGPNCTVLDASVALKNDGGSAVVFSFIKDSSPAAYETHSVAAKGSQTVKVTVGSGFKLTVRALGMTDKVIDLKAEAGCNKPAASTAQACKADGSGWNVTLKNDGKVEESFQVKAGDKILDTVKLAAGKSETKSYTFADQKVDSGKSVKLTVVVDGKTIQSSEITNDCSKVSADVATKCDTTNSGAVITFKNDGKVSEVFTVTRDGKAVEGSPVTVEAGKTVTKLLKLNEDETAKIVITTASGLKVEKTITLNCTEVSPTTVVNTTVAPTTVAPTTTAPAEVLGTQVVRAQLAATGTDVVPTTALGLLLLALGGGLLRARKHVTANR